MKKYSQNNQRGFSMIELLVAMTITLILMGLAGMVLNRALSVKSRESRRTDALTSAQAALNVMSREISNAGYGLADSTSSIHNNGIVLADSSSTRLRIRANVDNSNSGTTDLDEDITYYFDQATKSIVRYDPAQNPKLSYIVNRISEVTFRYYDYQGSSSIPTSSTMPSANTGRINITVVVNLDPVQGQPNDQKVTFTSDVVLRNSNYMMNQY